MENRYLAKSNEEKTIKEHTQDLLKQYEILKSIYSHVLTKEQWDLLKYVVMYHDLGKMNTKFQNKLYQRLGYEVLPDKNLPEEIPHNFLSPLFINTKKLVEQYGIENTKIIVSAVYYHHAREEKEIPIEIIEDLKQQAEKYEENVKIENSFRRYLLTNYYEEDIEILKSKEYILIKGLLHKLDYVASADKEGLEVEEKIKENGKSVADLVQEVIGEQHKNQYRPVQKYMKENKEENLIIVSYTGSGKTEAALLWLGSQKGFYTLPLKVSINAMYKRIEKDIKYRKAVLLHSDALQYYQELGEIIKYDRAKRMAAPLIVTTVDQLFKIVFRYGGYEEILATLSYSKIIIDEIQMYSTDIISYILVGLKMITEMGGKFAIITATFPPVLYNFMDMLEIPYKKQEEKFKPHLQNRHKMKVLEEIPYEKIKELGKKQKVLVIVNTVKRAIEVYEALQEENPHLLHSHFIRNDRNILEEKIMEFAKDEKANGIWISTQIVEASLDIDFDTLFTEMCSIDSLLQRMGRVYRKREYQQKEPNVYIIDNRNGVPYIINEQIYEFTRNEILKEDGNNLSEDKKQEMIKHIFSLEENKQLKESKYYKDIQKQIKNVRNLMPNAISKDTVYNTFRNIQNIDLIPDNIYDRLYDSGKIEEWTKILDSKQSRMNDKIKVKNEIKQFTISVRFSPKVIHDKNELFFRGSGIYRTSYIYEFNKETYSGRGLVMKEMWNTGYFDE